MRSAPKYLLMLKELKKATPEDHANYESVTQAVERFSDVLKYINDAKRGTCPSAAKCRALKVPHRNN